MKQIAIKLAGAEREPIDRLVKPGTTTQELLAHAKLAGYRLSNGKRMLDLSENIYMAVADGELLWASTPAKVG
jgi:hypothetical protein